MVVSAAPPSSSVVASAPVPFIDASSVDDVATRFEPPARIRTWVEKWRAPMEHEKGVPLLLPRAGGSIDAIQIPAGQAIDRIDAKGRRARTTDATGLLIADARRGPRDTLVFAGTIFTDVELPTIRIKLPKDGASYVASTDANGEALDVQILPVAGAIMAFDLDARQNIHVAVRHVVDRKPKVTVFRISASDGVHAGGESQRLFDVEDEPSEIQRATNGDWLARSLGGELVRLSPEGTRKSRIKLPPGTDVIPGPDGGLFVVGMHDSSLAIFVVALDKDGKRLWARTAEAVNWHDSCERFALQASAGAGADALVLRVRRPTGANESGVACGADALDGWPEIALFALDADGHTTWMAPFDPPTKCFVSPVSPMSLSWIKGPGAPGDVELYASFHCDSYRTGTCMYTLDPNCRSNSDPDAAVIALGER